MFEKEEEDEISKEKLARSYTVMYKSWVNTIKINEDLQGQIHQLSLDKGTLKKEVATLKREILKNSMAQSEVEHLKKIVIMMNSGTTSLDHILCMRTTSKAREGIGYQRGSLDSKLVAQREIPHLKTVKVEEPVRTLPRMGTTCLNKKGKFIKEEGKEVRCYYW